MSKETKGIRKCGHMWQQRFTDVCVECTICGVIDCPPLPQELSACCGTESMLCDCEDNCETTRCSKCRMPFLPHNEEKGEAKVVNANYLHVLGGHCFVCHKDYKGNNHESAECVKSIMENPQNIKYCGKFEDKECQFSIPPNTTWQETFKLFYDDNETGGSSRWKVSPNSVINFIHSTLATEREKVRKMIESKKWEHINEYDDKTGWRKKGPSGAYEHFTSDFSAKWDNDNLDDLLNNLK